MRSQIADDQRCPCTSGASFAECCQPYLDKQRFAPTAETLMRSRFTAFALGDEDYLLATWDEASRPASLDLGDSPIRFTRLEVHETSGGGPFDERGFVAFEAFYRSPAGAGSQKERSVFHRHKGRWVYSGEISGFPDRARRV